MAADQAANPMKTTGLLGSRSVVRNPILISRKDDEIFSCSNWLIRTHPQFSELYSDFPFLTWFFFRKVRNLAPIGELKGGSFRPTVQAVRCREILAILPLYAILRRRN